jgi:hypothetical protein
VKSLGGEITVLQLRYVKTEDMGKLSVLKISGKGMGEQNINKLLNAARKITRIGFHIPNLGGEEFKFWIGHWGGGTIYAFPCQSPNHIWSLIKFFKILFNNDVRDQLRGISCKKRIIFLQMSC